MLVIFLLDFVVVLNDVKELSTLIEKWTFGVHDSGMWEVESLTLCTFSSLQTSEHHFEASHKWSLDVEHLAFRKVGNESFCCLKREDFSRVFLADISGREYSDLTVNAAPSCEDISHMIRLCPDYSLLGNRLLDTATSLVSDRSAGTAPPGGITIVYFTTVFLVKWNLSWARLELTLF